MLTWPTLSVHDWFGALASMLASYLINWVCNPFSEWITRFIINLSNLIRAISPVTTQHANGPLHNTKFWLLYILCHKRNDIKILLVSLFSILFLFLWIAEHYWDLFPWKSEETTYLSVPWLHSSKYYAFLLLPETTDVSWCSKKVSAFLQIVHIFMALLY